MPAVSSTSGTSWVRTVTTASERWSASPGSMTRCGASSTYRPARASRRPRPPTVRGDAPLPLVVEAQVRRGDQRDERDAVGRAHRLCGATAIDDRDGDHGFRAGGADGRGSLQERNAPRDRIVGERDAIARLQGTGDAPTSAVVLLFLADAE